MGILTTTLRQLETASHAVSSSISKNDLRPGLRHYQTLSIACRTRDIVSRGPFSKHIAHSTMTPFSHPATVSHTQAHTGSPRLSSRRISSHRGRLQSLASKRPLGFDLTHRPSPSPPARHLPACASKTTKHPNPCGRQDRSHGDRHAEHLPPPAPSAAKGHATTPKPRSLRMASASCD